MGYKEIQQKREDEKNIVKLMVEVYCHKKHHTPKNQLCDECQELLDYAHARINYCPHMETKTFCSACKTHCYKKDMKERIKTVMRYSGPRMIFYHPILAIKHLFTTKSK